VLHRIAAALLVSSMSLALPAPVRAEAVFVAGVRPDRRPEGAPRITAVVHPQAWYVAAVAGIDRPYPQSLFFLDDQGDWFTPFIRPGMTGRYDIRGRHARENR
jgi:hypothetical protein